MSPSWSPDGKSLAYVSFESQRPEIFIQHLATARRGDPWVKGAYSCALPGQAHQREALARPIDQMLYFAGEATSRASFSTAHGAYLSGMRAVEEMRTGAR